MLRRPIAILIVALAAGGFCLGCSREAKPAAQPATPPEDLPPLPPESGTPIGYLVESAAELRLSDEQLGKLKAIGERLSVQLTGDDTQMRPEPVRASNDDKPRGLGFRAGGRDQRGASSEREAFPARAAGSSEQVIPASTVNQVYQQRAHHVRDAIREALGLLDSAQQVIARRLLVDHGVNLDTGEVRGEPGEALPDPKLGQPLPRENPPN